MTNIERRDVVRFDGMLDGTNASAVAFWKGLALVVTDEVTSAGNLVQVFEPAGTGFRAVPARAVVLDEPGDAVAEMDLEGIAVDGDVVFVLGSHSARRRRVDTAKPREKNRATLLGPAEPQPGRDVLLRFRFREDGRPGRVRRSSLRAFLNATEPFRSFAGIASKENGVDAEGLAVWDDHLYVGFRGPVLRGNFAPVVRCRFGEPVEDPEVKFLNLGGRGVRDLTRADDGLLVLAGPVGDGPGSYQLYRWDGRDAVPGADRPAGGSGLRLLGDLPLPAAADGSPPPKAEGLAVASETAAAWDVMVVFDGLAGGHATWYRVGKPAPSDVR